MKAVDILSRIDAFQYSVLPHVFWQRQLNQDAVDTIVLIQLSHFSKELLRSYSCRNRKLAAVNAELLASLCLHVHVGRRGGGVPHQHHSETGVNPALLQTLDFCGNLAFYVIGDFCSVNKARRHRRTSSYTVSRCLSS